MKIGFIGVGSMGAPMAAHLVAAGHQVLAFDIDPSRKAVIEGAGAHFAQSVEQVGRSTEQVIVMVANGDQLHAVMRDGLTRSMGAASKLIVMSSVGREAIDGVMAQVAQSGAAVVDAPVTGGVTRAITGELTILVGAQPAAFEAVRTVLECMGKPVICGSDVGDGQAFKLVNQLLCSVHLAAAGEALEFAKSLGLDPEHVLDTVGGGAAASFMLSDRGPRMLSDSDPPVLSAIDIFVKDSSLVLDAAASSGADVPIVRKASEIYKRAQDSGLGRADDSAVIKVFAGNRASNRTEVEENV